MRTVETESLVFMSVFCVSNAVVLHKAASGAGFLVLLPFCVLSWLVYVLSHYRIEGAITQDTVESVFPERTGKLKIAGLAAMIASFPLGGYAALNSSFWQMLASQLCFVYGFMAAQKAMRGKVF